MPNKRVLFYKLIPTAIILVCIAVLSRFFAEPFKFPINTDDCLYSALLQKFSIWELIQILPGKYSGIYIAHFDGRMFSNFYSLLVFSLLKTHQPLYYLYDLFMFMVLTASFYFLINSLVKKEYISGLTFFKKILLSIFTSSTVFVFLIDGRYEVFYWVSGISNHLLSIIFFIFLLILFISEFKIWRALLVLLLSFCLGQMNEVYAVSYLLVFLCIAIARPSARIFFTISLVMVFISLYINFTSYGTALRFNTLHSIHTHFNILFSLEDTRDTLLLPFVNYRYLPIKIPIVILWFVAIRNYFNVEVFFSAKYFLLFNRVLLMAALASIFLYCYIMGEICTYRCLLLFVISIIYFIFMMASKKMFNPLKLFFK